MYYVSLETEAIKGFSVSLQLLCFRLRFREMKAIKRMRYVRKIGEKEHTEIFLVFGMLFR